MAERRRVHETYRQLLEPHSERLGIELPYEHPGDRPADHMFYVLLPDAGHRAEIISSMRSCGVTPTFHYVPLHSAPGAAILADRLEECPVTDAVSARLLRLPFFNDLATSDQERVVDTFVRAVDSTTSSVD